MRSTQVSQDGLNMGPGAIDMREVRIGLIENQREVRSRKHYPIHRQFLCNSRQNGPRFSSTGDCLHVGLVNRLHLIRYNHLDSFEHAEHARLYNESRAEQCDSPIPSRTNLRAHFLDDVHQWKRRNLLELADTHMRCDG